MPLSSEQIAREREACRRWWCSRPGLEDEGLDMLTKDTVSAWLAAKTEAAEQAQEQAGGNKGRAKRLCKEIMHHSPSQWPRLAQRAHYEWQLAQQALQPEEPKEDPAW